VNAFTVSADGFGAGPDQDRDQPPPGTSLRCRIPNSTREFPIRDAVDRIFRDQTARAAAIDRLAHPALTSFTATNRPTTTTERRRDPFHRRFCGRLHGVSRSSRGDGPNRGGPRRFAIR